MSWFACFCGVNDDDVADDVTALQPPIVSNPGVNDQIARQVAQLVQPNQLPIIQFEELEAITKNFAESSLIGVGSFAKGYDGVLKSGKRVVIKLLTTSQQPDEQFLAQVSMASRLDHPNFLKLLGFCVDVNSRVLVYEYASKGSLSAILHGKMGDEESQPGPVLTWEQRVKIASDVAKGIEYLHMAEPPIIHRNIGSHNVLIFDDYVAKVSDFDLTNQDPSTVEGPESSHVLQRIGHLSPEFRKDGTLSAKGDIYGFGVILLELLTGRKPVDYTLPSQEQHLVTWATPKLSGDKILEYVDPRLGDSYLRSGAAKMAAIAALCLQYEADVRPSMGIVVTQLQPLLDPRIERAGVNDETARQVAQLVQPNQHLIIQFEELKAITDNFAESSLIGAGSFAKGYDGVLKSGKRVVIKLLNTSQQPDEQFLAQVSTASQLDHPNFLKLLGFCVDVNSRVLVYEYASKGSLSAILHGKMGDEESQPGPVLTWEQRVKIASDVAKGIEYLHMAEPPIIHRNIGSHNVLIFDDYVAKVSDFDLTNQDPSTVEGPESSHVLQRIGHLSPEFRKDGTLSAKGDIYGFGVILLELLTGRKPVDYTLPSQEQHLVTWATPKLSGDKILEYVDPRLGDSYLRSSAAKMAAISALCLQYEAHNRPGMGTVVTSLQPLLG